MNASTNLVSVRLVTAGVARLVAFYERVTGVDAAWATPSFAEIVTPVGTLAVAGLDTLAVFGGGIARAAANHSAIVEFLVADVDAVRAGLGPDVEIVQDPTTMPWGNRSLLVRDPDGTLVNLFTPATDAARRKFARAAV